MMKNEARSRALVLALMASAPLAGMGCGAERAAGSEMPAAAPAPVRAAVELAPAVVKTSPRNDVTVFADGSSRIGPRITDVASLKLLPDGTYARTCGPPDPETRTMMEGMMRARMGSRR